MATRLSASRARPARKQSVSDTPDGKVPPPARDARPERNAKSRSAEGVDGVPVPEGLREAIEVERGNLSKVESVLRCLVIAMEYEADSFDGPHYPDVAQVAYELVARSIDGLDSLVLQQRLLHNKIKEAPGLPCIGSYLTFDPTDSQACGPEGVAISADDYRRELSSMHGIPRNLVRSSAYHHRLQSDSA
jgi:hypothetical protein